ncbi:MAG: alpha/beta hydrolase [Caulobacteraceae bacterium]|nr:alpha/beta hydrolase [Caulobacter sp.]
MIPSPEADAARGWVERAWRSADGLVLSARDYPGAAGLARLPVICLHGLTRNARDFEEVAPRLAASGRRVLALDVRGRGRSARDPQPMNYVVPTYATDVAALAAQAGIARAVFVGTSMGGLITMALATAAPMLVAAAVLNDIGPEIGATGLARIGRYAGGDAPVADWPAAAAYARAINAAAFPHYGDAEWDAFARRLFNDAQGRPVLDYDPAIAEPMRAAQGQPTPDLWPLFDTLAKHRPLLLVRGETSDILEAQVAERMVERADRLRLVTLPGVGHAPMLTEPEAMDALLTFLAEVD